MAEDARFPDPLSPESKGSFKWLRCCSIVFLIFVLLIVATILGARWYFNQLIHKDMSPEEIAEMERFFEEPIGIPEAWQEVEPFSFELVEAAENVRAKWNALGEPPALLDEDWSAIRDQLRAGKPLSPNQWEAIGQVVETYEDYMAAVTELVNLPEYELQAFPPEEPDDYKPDFLMMQQTAKLLCLQAYAQGHRGEWKPAFESALTAMKLGSRHPASHLITHLLAFAAEGIAADCLTALARDCDDPATLRSTLDEMNRIDPQINLDNLVQAMLIDEIGMLREFKRQGYSVDLDPNQTGSDLFRQHLAIAQEASAIPSSTSGTGSKTEAETFLPDMMLRMLYNIARPNFLETHIRERLAKSKFDLARLALASRIAQLEGGTISGSTLQFVPKYFPENLQDPFSSAPYIWDSSAEVFYSVGPDTQSENNRLRYDPTNGSISTGDVSLF